MDLLRSFRQKVSNRGHITGAYRSEFVSPVVAHVVGNGCYVLIR